MRIHPITLNFSGPHQALELTFRQHYFHSTLRQVRIALIVAAFFFNAYGFFDALAVPEQKYFFWALRWGFTLPVGVIVFAFTFSRYADRFMQPVLAFTTLLAGAVVIFMIMVVPESKQFSYLAGLAQIQFYVYMLLRIRFIWASSCLSLLLLGYFFGAQIYATIPADRLWSDMAFLFGINLMGMLACYAIEYFTRKNFFLSRQLETKKRRLALMNRFLEKRVEKRTAQWKNANELLEKEIAGRNQIERALQESKLRYRRMVNNVTDHMCVHDLAGTIVDVNYRVISGLGFSHKELVGRHLQDMIVPEQRLNFSTYLKRLRQGHKATGKVTFISKTGQLLFMEYSSVKARHTEEGDVVYCLARDVTERQRTEKALAESQARFKDIFETAAAGMMIVNRKSQTIVEVNPAAAQMIREPVRDIKGRVLDQLIRTDTTPADDLQTPSCLSEVDPAECQLICGRETIPILQTIRPMEFSGQPHWLISFISLQKIKEAESAQREAESHLNRSQHLQAIGTLAGGIAHDFNNILYGVIGYAQLALDDASRGTVLHDNIREILQGCHRAKELVGQIMTFSRQDDSQKKSVHLTPLIKEALNLLRASIPATIEIQTDIAHRTAPVLANSTQIHQVIMNLCTNAAQSMLPQGGHLRVVLEQLDIQTEENALHGPVAAGAYVRLAVIDTGCGIQEELKYRIFEPFFTTKTHGQGTGMGLAVVLGAVQAHGGAIRLDSEPGKGTRFEILLPAIKSSRELEPDPHVALTGGWERILLVDDEKALIQMGLQMLTRLGYHVTPFQDPLEALQAFRDRPADFDLVITDLTMPKMKGTRLAQHMLNLNPEIPIILCTGYGDEVTPEQIEEIGIRELLLKPILRQHLAVAIRKALECPVVESSHS